MFEAHGPCTAAIEPGHKGGQVVAHIAGGKLGRAAVQVGTRTGRGGRSIRHFAGVAGGAEHPGEGNAQFVRHDLGDLGVQALTHLGTAMVHLYAAVGVHMHQRAGLVEQRGREADAELDRRDGDAALKHWAGLVPCRNRLYPPSVLRG